VEEARYRAIWHIFVKGYSAGPIGVCSKQHCDKVASPCENWARPRSEWIGIRPAEWGLHDPHVLDEHAVAPDDNSVAAARKDPTLEPGPLEHAPADTDQATIPRVGLSDFVQLIHLERHLKEQLETRLRQ
jgi:hypothetical protein